MDTAGNLARSQQTVQAGFTVFIDSDAAHKCVSRRCDLYGYFRDIYAFTLGGIVEDGIVNCNTIVRQRRYIHPYTAVLSAAARPDFFNNGPG